MEILIDLTSIQLTENSLFQISIIKSTTKTEFSFIDYKIKDLNTTIIIDPESKWKTIYDHCRNKTNFSIITNDFVSDENLWSNIVLNHNDELTIDSLTIAVSLITKTFLSQPRKFVMSDIHGCFDQFNQMIKLINFQPRDRFICLGDLVDRGPKSKQVIQLCIDLPGDNIFIRGNHEEMLLSFLNQPALWQGIYTKPVNGGMSTLNSYMIAEFHIEIPEHHIDFLETMCDTFIEHDDYIYVHAGLNPHFDLNNQTPEDCKWIRSDFLNYQKKFPKKVIHGHTPTESTKIEFYHNRIDIDCGCVFGGNLACLELNNMKEYYVPNMNCSDIV